VRIGVLEILAAEVGGGWFQKLNKLLIRRQYASVMPQAVSVWCRQLGHQTFYATYYGQSDPKSLLPDDLDIVFISAYTRATPLAYALARLYRQDGVITVAGGPHAKVFPEDCLRFFDVVVRECDRELIAEILLDPPRGEIVSSGRPLLDLPSIEQRLPEIQTSILWRGRAHPAAVVPVLASVGCPYQCDFCVDWDNPYFVLPRDKIAADLRFISERLPGAKVGFHDPNFAVRFDQTMDILEQLPPGARSPYLMESSLSILRESRLPRLTDTNCWFVAPGVESWTAYSNKSGVGGQESARQKLDRVVSHFELIHQHVPGIQANFMFGIDADRGDVPVELTKEFMTRAPFVSSTVNIPVPFGGTPLFDQYLADDRILRSMPFAFYRAPYLTIALKHYDPEQYYAGLVDIMSHWTSTRMLLKRVSTVSGLLRLGTAFRMLDQRRMLGEFRTILELLRTDRPFRAFHEQETDVLPDFYKERHRDLLGPYAGLLSDDDRRPVLPSIRAIATTAPALP